MKIYEIFDRLQEELRSFMPHQNWPSNRAVGIEVELEGAGMLESTRLWNCISDGSLRNDGRELVTKLPLAGMDLQLALDELDPLLRTAGVVASERTSIHVHVDVRDLTTEQVGNVLATYIACEAALYNFGGKNRYDNIYCPGVSAAQEQMSVMRKVMSSDQYVFAHGIHDWCKYTGINLRSICERGSIEFRGHEGTLDVARIEKWIKVLQQMFVYAIKTKRNDILEQAKVGPANFLTGVFGIELAQELLQDGIYVQYYNNNIINLIDLFDTSDEYVPEHAQNSAPSASTPDGDVSSIISAIQSVLEGGA